MIFESVSREIKAPVRLSLQQWKNTLTTHYHSEAEILYILEGKMTIYTSLGNCELTVGDILIIPPYAEHAILPFNENCKRLALLFDIDKIINALSSIIEEKEIKSCISNLYFNSQLWDIVTRSKIQELMMKVFDEYSTRKSGFDLSIISYVFQIYLICKREIPSDCIHKISNQSNENKLIQKTLNYISNNYTNPITLDSCAEYVGLNPSYLSRLFHNTLKIPFHSFINQLRIEQAKWLLINEPLTISEIAFRAGFENIKTFNRVFKQITNKTPSTFKKHSSSSPGIL